MVLTRPGNGSPPATRVCVVGMLGGQRGSVYLEYALLASAIAFAGAVLIRIHHAFALLLPVAVLVFFLPNLMGLAARLRAGRSFRGEVAAALKANPGAVVLKNGLAGFDAQALLLDGRRREAAFVTAEEGTRTVSWDEVGAVRAVRAGESSAVSFHRGTVRIPPRYMLVFEFGEGEVFRLVTLKRKVMTAWLDGVRPVFGDRLVEEPPGEGARW